MQDRRLTPNWALDPVASTGAILKESWNCKGREESPDRLGRGQNHVCDWATSVVSMKAPIDANQ